MNASASIDYQYSRDHLVPECKYEYEKPGELHPGLGIVYTDALNIQIWFVVEQTKKACNEAFGSQPVVNGNCVMI